MKFPQSFPLCNRENCPQAAQCLRRMAWDGIEDTECPTLFIVNPLLTATDGHCPSFHQAQPVKTARGFRNALAKMPHGGVGKVAGALSKVYGLRAYYKMRCGEHPLTPHEQEQVADALKRFGAQEPIIFDNYYDDYVWQTDK